MARSGTSAAGLDQLEAQIEGLRARFERIREYLAELRLAEEETVGRLVAGGEERRAA